ncbi:hypothetical protein MNEG_9558 [Monoraphidium neglectum]|uniref:CSC1/OSCA1-like N-terminal transmembrane domain-containing protein n=1 Tax=Monoraphidium neglectum TaxID=145388 RepID=A0A0D2MVQ0_9CHLO|nr:hypothetical protein MNEG_9558 [Monoraphidium neglectum]KIY98405.1 hypothetical protein MNEG_9558 [Monoraphidium neglectum]|eukprot:XP_013897425.1 hypothetical protein MNEG_9558 [Monoraphidium neglectum]
MFERLIVFGLQLFAPITVLSLSILVPIHATSHYLEESLQSKEVTATLMGLTMSAMKDGSQEMWVHICLVYLYVAYAMWLMDGHYKWYVLLRQHYLTMGDSVSPWLGHAVSPRHGGVLKASTENGGGGGGEGDGMLGSAEWEDGLLLDGEGDGQPGAGGRAGCYSAPGQQSVVEMVHDGGGGPSLHLPTFLRRGSGGLGGLGGSLAGGSPGSARRKAAKRQGAGGDVFLEENVGCGDGGGGSPRGRGRSRRRELVCDDEEEEEEEAWRESKAEAARVARSAEASGADAEWWEFRAGDPLIDRHITQLDIDSDLSWAQAEPAS